MLPLAVTHLIHGKVLDWSTLVEKVSANPARLLGLTNKGTLRVGADADVTVIDPDVEWSVDAYRFQSKSRNCPYHGNALRGQALDQPGDGLR
jgi:dihydroorotase